MKVNCQAQCWLEHVSRARLPSVNIRQSWVKEAHADVSQTFFPDSTCHHSFQLPHPNQLQYPIRLITTTMEGNKIEVSAAVFALSPSQCLGTCALLKLFIGSRSKQHVLPVTCLIARAHGLLRTPRRLDSSLDLYIYL